MPYKKCPSCAADNGPRAQSCKSCGKPIASKTTVEEKPKQAKTTTIPTTAKTRTKRVPKPKEREPVKDWTLLKKGDLIHVNGGPYWLRAGEEDISENRVPMGESGKFRVSYLDMKQQAIFAYCKDEAGLHMIYMGPVCRNDSAGIMRRAHKVYIVNIKERK